MNYLFVIPARAGSKGIPGKNKKLLNGKPLISYSIECALDVTTPDKICVTTDDEDVIKIGLNQEVPAPFKRPAELSTDKASSFDVLKHALDFYEGKGEKIDAVVLLQPTSPLRNSTHLKEALAKYNNDIDMVVSVTKAVSKLIFVENEFGFLEKEQNAAYYEMRQDAGNKYCFNGAIYIINANSLKNKKVTEYEKIVKYEMDEKSSMDIDTILDWEIVEFLMSKNTNA